MGKILVVDDSEVVRIKISNILTEADHEVFEASDGPEGVRIASENPDIQIVLTDYNMPEMDGLTMVEKVKEINGMENAFYAVLTTESSPTLKEKGKAVGVRLWIVKPVDKKNLLKITDTIFKKLSAA